MGSKAPQSPPANKAGLVGLNGSPLASPPPLPPKPAPEIKQLAELAAIYAEELRVRGLSTEKPIAGQSRARRSPSQPGIHDRPAGTSSPTFKTPAGNPLPLVVKIAQPGFPQFLFEWHLETQKVFVIGLPGRFEDRTFIPAIRGNARCFILSEHCDNHAAYYAFVQTYLRGYRQGLADEALMAKGEALIPTGYAPGPEVTSAGTSKGSYES